MIRIIALSSIFLINFLGCKPQQQVDSSAQSLENFAAGKDIKQNSCTGSDAAKSQVSTSAIVETTKKLAGGQLVNLTESDILFKENLRNSISALPEGLRNLFIGELNGRIELRSDVNDSQKGPCSFLSSGAQGKNIGGCYRYFTETKETPRSLKIYLLPEISTIRHNLVRLFGYAFSQKIARLKIGRVGDKVSVESLPSDLIAVAEAKVAAANAFFRDVRMHEKSKSPQFSFENIGNFFGGQIPRDKIDSALAKSSKNILAEIGMNADKSRELADFIFAESFDSFYCNAEAEVSLAPFKEIEKYKTSNAQAVLAALQSTKNSRVIMSYLFHESLKVMNQFHAKFFAANLGFGLTAGGDYCTDSSPVQSPASPYTLPNFGSASISPIPSSFDSNESFSILRPSPAVISPAPPSLGTSKVLSGMNAPSASYSFEREYVANLGSKLNEPVPSQIDSAMAFVPAANEIVAVEASPEQSMFKSFNSPGTFALNGGLYKFCRGLLFGESDDVAAKSVAKESPQELAARSAREFEDEKRLRAAVEFSEQVHGRPITGMDTLYGVPSRSAAEGGGAISRSSAAPQALTQPYVPNGFAGARPGAYNDTVDAINGVKPGDTIVYRTATNNSNGIPGQTSNLAKAEVAGTSVRKGSQQQPGQTETFVQVRDPVTGRVSEVPAGIIGHMRVIPKTDPYLPPGFSPPRASAYENVTDTINKVKAGDKVRFSFGTPGSGTPGIPGNSSQSVESTVLGTIVRKGSQQQAGQQEVFMRVMDAQGKITEVPAGILGTLRIVGQGG